MKQQVKRRVIAEEDDNGIWHIVVIETVGDDERTISIAMIAPQPWKGWSEHFAKEIAAALNARWRVKESVS